MVRGSSWKARETNPIPTEINLVTEKAVVKFETYKKYSTAVEKVMSLCDCDTVGADAIDGNDNLATATSIGGISAKLPGRVGDSCIIADQAAKQALDFMSQRVGGTAGMIDISTAEVTGTARVAHHCTTTNMTGQQSAMDT
ncbi:isoaspartyl peptidase/l-asparaginase [Plakobranchus ocellatus]|uniref:Isoaspartyl peptidase/l-asparaginase n=1 Tax=Plakobranchus ocellatus TaxID=259542 RepID=A0AAV4BQB4_9GAST|nr:isoaspartyl peptidase/l-asparaginase [Plakobranchus ocellatus]